MLTILETVLLFSESLEIERRLRSEDFRILTDTEVVESLLRFLTLITRPLYQEVEDIFHLAPM
jgi:hypothetical protein